ncbi:MAG: NAD-dependent epimerase/dehydratase family protein [Candidatus Borkfalkiaceae bacterium]|nr:NAD-dependent epimerase/dehydratase family protein [Christensenellaceae bacterium]
METIYVVTGCTGYVGNVLTKKLMSENARVTGLARNPEKVKRVFGENPPDIVYGDVRNPEDVARLFRSADAEYVVLHTVAFVTIGEGSADDLFGITVGGTSNVVKEALRHKVGKFLQISSTDAIPEGVRLSEDLSDYRPSENRKSGYSAAKSRADEIVLQAAREQGLNASILLFSSVLGPGDYSRSHMSQVMCDCAAGKLPASVDAGYNDFDIRDVADVLPAIVEKSRRGECYLFANRPDKINDVLHVVAEKYGRKPPVTLPMWVAYAGLPFLTLYAKIRGKRPLYTRAALAPLRGNADFPIGKARREFGYSPRPLRQTVLDHLAFLESIGEIRPETTKSYNPYGQP